MAKSARIDSPDILRRFRGQFIVFDNDARRALDGVKADVTKTIGWLRGQQLGYWKQQLRKREELVLQAKNAYQSARLGGHSSCVDEIKALRRAQRMKEEAEGKIESVKEWIVVVERKAGQWMGPCTRLSVQLAELTPRALARLDTMLDSLDAYFRASSDGAGVSSSGT